MMFPLVSATKKKSMGGSPLTLRRLPQGKLKKVKLTSVVPLGTWLVYQEADGAHLTFFLHQCSVLRVFKAEATRIRENMEKTWTFVKRIEPHRMWDVTHQLSRACSCAKLKYLSRETHKQMFYCILQFFSFFTNRIVSSLHSRHDVHQSTI